MKLSNFCFLYAALSAVIGIGMGVAMVIAENFTLMPVHAHLNLLGWVTMAVYGLYHRGSADGGWLAIWQVGIFAAGVPMMTGGLAGLLLTGAPAFLPVTIAGAFLVLAGAALFLALVWRVIRVPLGRMI